MQRKPVELPEVLDLFDSILRAFDRMAAANPPPADVMKLRNKAQSKLNAALRLWDK